MCNTYVKSSWFKWTTQCKTWPRKSNAPQAPVPKTTTTQKQNNNKNKTKTEKISGEGGKIKSYYICYFPWTSNARNDHRRTNGRDLVINFNVLSTGNGHLRTNCRNKETDNSVFLTPSQPRLLHHGKSQGVGYEKGGGCVCVCVWGGGGGWLKIQ